MFPILRLTVFSACVAVPLASYADFSYQETTQITGGSIMGMMKMVGVFSSQARKADQPITSSVYVQGNRMARVRPDGMEIIDLDKETITTVDTAKRQYSVMTFEQMKQQLEQAEREAQKKAAAQPQASSGSQEAGKQPDKVDMSFDVHVQETGAAKQVSGLDTKEAILTMAMVAKDKTTQQQGALNITSDMWMAPEIPGYYQVRDFDERFAKKMGKVLGGGAPGMAAMLNQPGAQQGLQDLAKETSKLKGVPILQVMRMGSTADGKPLPAASEAPLPPPSTGPAGPTAGDIAQQAATSTATSVIATKMGSVGSGLASGLGGLGSFHRKSKQQQPSPDASTAASGQQAPAAAAANGANGTTPAAMVLIESNTTLGGFSSAPIDGSHFSVPSGYQQVQPKNLNAGS